MKRFIILFLLIFAVNAFAHGPFPKIKKSDTNFIYVSGDSVGIVLLTGDTLWFGSGIYYNSTHDSTLATQEWVTLQGYSSSTSDSVLYADSAYFADSALGAVRAETSDSTNKALRDASGNIITSTYITTESDPNALLTAGTDNVKDTHIDFGTGAGQVSMTDMKGGNDKIFYSNGTGSVTEVTLGSSGTYLKSQGTGFIPTFDTPSGAGLTYWTESDAGDTSVFTATSPNTILGLGNSLSMMGNNIDNWWFLSAWNGYDAAIQPGNDYSLYLMIPQDSNKLIIQIGNFKWYFNKDSLYSQAGGHISIDTLTVDSGLYVGDDITVTGTVDGVDISTLSTTVGKVTDDTTTWKTVASLFDTSYKFLTVDSSQLDTITTHKVKIATTLILGSDSITDITGTGLSVTGGVLNSSGSSPFVELTDSTVCYYANDSVISFRANDDTTHIEGQNSVLKIESGLVVGGSGSYIKADTVIGSTILILGDTTSTGYRLPLVDGTTGQIMSTNGNGALSFTDQLSGADGQDADSIQGDPVSAHQAVNGEVLMFSTDSIPNLWYPGVVATTGGLWDSSATDDTIYYSGTEEIIRISRDVINDSTYLRAVGTLVLGSVGVTKIDSGIISGTYYPVGYGVNGQVLTTNGAGIASWADQTGGVDTNVIATNRSC